MWLVTPGITLIKGFVNLSDLVQKFKGAQIYTFIIGEAELNSLCECLFYVYAPQF